MSEHNMAAEDEFLSLRDMVLMVFRHRWWIIGVVALVTVFTAVSAYLAPRKYEVEGYLQVLPKFVSGGRPDRDLFETGIMSHLQRVQSAFIADRVAEYLSASGAENAISAINLQRRVKISRPPKTDLIRVVSRAADSEEARVIVAEWMRQYLQSVRANNLVVEISQLRERAQRAQMEAHEKQSNVTRLRMLMETTPESVTLSKGLGDVQLWKELADRADPQKLADLSEINIRDQAVSVAHMSLRNSLTQAEQLLAEAVARRDFYEAVIKALEQISAQPETAASDVVPVATPDASVAQYVQMLMRGVVDSDIVPFGEPAVLSARRGAIRKTMMAALATAAAACMLAFMIEWLRDPKK